MIPKIRKWEQARDPIYPSARFRSSFTPIDEKLHCQSKKVGRQYHRVSPWGVPGKDGKMKMTRFFTAIALVCVSFAIFAQETVFLSDGRQAILHEDMTWELAEDSSIDSPEAVLRRYLNAANRDEKLSTIRLPDVYRPMFADRYEDGASMDFVRIEHLRDFSTDDLHVDVFRVYVMGMRGNQPFEVPIRHFVVDDGSGPRVDWQASRATGESEWPLFNATKPEETVLMRAQVSLSSSGPYMLPNQLQRSFYAFDVYDWIGNRVGSAVVERESDAGEALIDLGSSGRRIDAMISVRYDYGFRSFDPVMVIDNVVQTDWITRESTVIPE